MILVQRRGPQFHAVIRALKRAGVPVAGADVLRLGGELAVKDLLAALRVAATPEDDLSLAAVLRSPLGGLTEEELFALAHGRRGRLLEALRRQPPEAWPGPRAMLEDLREEFPIAGEKRTALEEQHVFAALDWLAKFHGFWWARSSVVRKGQLRLAPLEEAQRAGPQRAEGVWLNGGYTYVSSFASMSFL